VTILALDPGPLVSHGVYLNSDLEILDTISEPNRNILDACVMASSSKTLLVIEGITPQAKVGHDTLETVFWSGRFCEMAGDFVKVNRVDVKKYFKVLSQFDGNMNDKLIKDAIRENFPNGDYEKKLRGKAHCWQALALGIAYYAGIRSKSYSQIVAEKAEARKRKAVINNAVDSKEFKFGGEIV